MEPRKTSGTTSDGSLSDLTFLAAETREGGETEGQSTVQEVLRLWARGADGRGQGAARAVTLGRAARRPRDGIGSDRPRGNSIETRDERMARAPCDGRGAREKRPRPMSRPRGAKERVMREKNGGARALTGQQALDEAEDLPDPLALSGDLVMIAHLPRAALPEQPERVGKRLREVGWRIRLAAAGREPNHLRRGHPRKGRTAGRVGAVVPAAAASRRSNFRSRGSGTFLDRVRDPALDPRASRGRGVFPHASRSFQLSVRRSFTTEAVTSRPRLADRDLLERDLRDANFASPFPETQKATMTSTLAPARARQLCARS